MSSLSDHLSRRRRLLLMLMPTAFLLWQVPHLAVINTIAHDHLRAVDGVQLVGSLLWIAAMVMLFLSGGRALRKAPPEARAALEDELVQANRAAAFRFGYFVTLITAGLVYVASIATPLPGGDAALIVLMAAVVSPMYAFAFLERRND